MMGCGELVVLSGSEAGAELHSDVRWRLILKGSDDQVNWQPCFVDLRSPSKSTAIIKCSRSIDGVGVVDGLRDRFSSDLVSNCPVHRRLLLCQVQN